MRRHSNPHDTLFKEVFSRPAQAAALLRYALPDHASRQIRWDRLELQDSSVRGDDGELRVDLMFRAPAPPHCPPFFVLEHKSGPDASTPYQLFRYVAAIWHRNHVRRRRHPVVLPAVFSVVVAHGPKRWRLGRALEQLVDWFWPEPERMQSLAIFLLNLTGMTSDELRNLPLPALARVALFCLVIARDSRDVCGKLRAWLPELRALQADDDGVRGLQSVLRYLVQVAKVPWADLKELFTVEVGPIAKEVLMSTLSEYTKEVREQARAAGLAKGLAKGLAEGLAEGQAKGHAKGLAEGQARILLKQLSVRFGKLPVSVERRVRRASAPERERWAGRLLAARTLAEVLRPD